MNKINQLTPQMKLYNQIGFEWKPFLMNLQKVNFRSDVVNTDLFGLRFNKTIESNSIFETKKNEKKKAALVGSSTVFGVGATSDIFTIPSVLSDVSNIHYYNIGGRAYSGFQEIILFNSLINNFKDIEEIILFSGLNDIFLDRYIDEYDQVLGPMFFNNQFYNLMNKGSQTWKKKIIENMLEFFKKKQKIEPTKKKNIKEIIKRNLKCWSIIRAGLNTKLCFFLQPFANWCNRELSNEEKIIFGELDKISVKTNKTLQRMDITLYNEFKLFIKNICNEYEIKFFDCNDYLSDKQFDRKWIFVDRVHLTDMGNKNIANFIKSKI